MKRKHLYRGGAERAEERAFERRYGRRKGRRVYGAVVGKVAREQAAEQGGEKTEEVRAHSSTSSRGRRFRVREHEAVVTPEEEDQPRSGRGKHPVAGHWETVNGKRTWVREHEAKDPRR